MNTGEQQRKNCLGMKGGQAPVNSSRDGYTRFKEGFAFCPKKNSRVRNSGSQKARPFGTVASVTYNSELHRLIAIEEFVLYVS
eukprot:scaffold10888_cov78-Skeletonema_dohrnii-CCMP3373.AAC.1